MVEIDESLYKSWVRLLHRFISVANKFRIFLLSFLRFQLWRIPWFFFIIMIKILSVPTVLDLRYIRWFSLSEFLPVDACEERMSFDLFNSIDSQSIFRICNELSNLVFVYLMRSTAWMLTLASWGITKYFLQFWILYHVYLGVSEAKGGYPTNISNKITPIDHQSTVSVYPTI